MKKAFDSIAGILLAMVLVMGIVVFAAPRVNVQAAKMTNKKAQKILKKVIKNKFCKYAFIDLDGDKIDEIIVAGYSGKFTKDGDDKKKSITVYRVSGKEAKAILTQTAKGDFYHPSLTFDVYKTDAAYITVNFVHEGYGTYTTYKFNGEKFVEVAKISVDYGDNNSEYFLENEQVGKGEFNLFIKDILENQVDVKIKSCSTKVANKYLKKMLKAELAYRVSLGYYETDTPDYVFSDEDGDGIEEMIIRTGPQNGEILYAYEDEYSYDYLIGVTTYSTVDGKVVFEKD